MKKLLFICLTAFTIVSCKKSTPTAPVITTTEYSANKFERNGLILNWESNNPSFSINLKQKMVETFFTVYPTLFNYWNPGVRKEVFFKIDRNYDGVAYANFQTGVIVFSSNYMSGNPNDNDVITHELTHITQAYPKYDPVWLVEGLADFSRYKFGINNAAQNWSLPNLSANHYYTDSYNVTARFVAWVDIKYPGSAKTLDVTLRNGAYTEAIWKTITQKTLQELWASYVASPALQP